MFALRMCYPSMVYLAPLLRHRLPMNEFLAMRVAQSYLVDPSQPQLDYPTLQWHHAVDGWTEEFFGQQHASLLAQIRWQVVHVLVWLPAWLTHVGTLGWDEWSRLDIDLQRLWVLLDYEQPPKWFSRILSRPKYIPWVAKLVVFSLMQWEALKQFDPSLGPPAEGERAP